MIEVIFHHVTNAEKMTANLNPLILLHEKKLTNLQPMVPLLEAVVQAEDLNDNFEVLKEKL